jgi:hypothetical protein
LYFSARRSCSFFNAGRSFSALQKATLFLKIVYTLAILLSGTQINFVLHKVKHKKMTTQEVAKRYYELIRMHQYEQIQNELYIQDTVSIEPENDSNLPLAVTGIEELRKKEGLFFSQVQEMHGGYMSEPVVSTFFFSMMTGMDVTMRGKQRKKKEQICVFEVRSGKIVKEQFFYDDFA